MTVKEMKVIATNQVHFPLMVLVYEITDEYVIAKIGHAAKGMGYYVEKQTARKYKLYYNVKRESYYFQWNGQRFYLDETLNTFEGMGW